MIASAAPAPNGPPRQNRSAFQERAWIVMRSNGRRMTRQRAVVLDVMEQAAGHLDVDELYQRARGRDPGISLSTVYRTLLVLKAHGLVDELHLSEEHHHYEIRQSDDHYHVVCRTCGTIDEVTSELARQLRADALSQIGFQVEAMDLDIGGRCQRCRATT